MKIECFDYIEHDDSYKEICLGVSAIKKQDMDMAKMEDGENYLDDCFRVTVYVDSNRCIFSKLQYVLNSGDVIDIREIEKCEKQEIYYKCIEEMLI